MKKFNAVKTKDDCIEWITDWFNKNGKNCNAIIAVSGGADSSIVTSLCVQALGKDRVVGVLMPNGKQHDINCAYQLCDFLDIKRFVIDIKDIVNSLTKSVKDIEISQQSKINLPPRIRMATLYYVSQSLNGRVANTCNLSEDWVGYSTRYGDSVGDFSPLSKLTKTEVKQIGIELGLPKELVYKTPSDGLCGKTDEDNLGFTYETLDRYIREGVCEDKNIKEKIDTLHNKNLFKLQLMPTFDPKI